MKALLPLAALILLTVGCAENQSHLRVRSSVEAQGDALSACYADLLEVDRDADGIVHVALTVDTDGRVDDVRVDSREMADEELPVCVSSALSRMAVREPPSQPSRLSYTFRFRPTG